MDSQLLATCIGVSVFGDALSYGQQYTVLAHDADKKQVRVRGDNGRSRWFPAYCFDMTGQPAVRMIRYSVEDSLDEPGISVEVVLEFSNGDRRWCYFTTPEILAELGGDADFGDAGRLLAYGSPHAIVVSAITEATIRQSLAYIESQGMLLSSSLQEPERRDGVSFGA